MAERQPLLDKVAALSEREREVFHRVSAGQMNKVIAQDPGISVRTVEVHLARVMERLSVRTLAQLVHIKIEAELVPKTWGHPHRVTGNSE